MPGDERSPRVISPLPGQDQLAGFIDHRPHRLNIIGLAGDEDRQIITQPHQPPVKHPVRCSRKGNAVANDIGAVVFHRFDMRGLNLSPATPVDQPEAGNGALVVIGPEDDFTEIAIPHRPVGDEADPVPHGRVEKGEGGFCKFLLPCGLVHPGQDAVFITQPLSNDAREIGCRESADGGLSAP